MAGIWRVLRDTLQSRCPAGRPERLRLKKLKKEEAVALHLKLSCKIFKTIYVVCILQLQHLASSFPCKIANFEWYVGSCNITSSTQFNHQRITNRFTTRHKSIKALTWNGTYCLLPRCLPLSVWDWKSWRRKKNLLHKSYLHQDYTFMQLQEWGEFQLVIPFNMSLKTATFEWCCTMMCHRYVHVSSVHQPNSTTTKKRIKFTTWDQHMKGEEY
jgi:hypothetical protein